MLEMKYFVLKPKAKNRGDLFAKASQEAMARFAEIIVEVDEDLANDLLDWANKEHLCQSRLAPEINESELNRQNRC